MKVDVVRHPSSAALSKATTTVAMPAFNTSTYIDDAIQSILGQTYTSFILHVHDDGSSDDTVDVALAYSDDRILISRSENSGQAAARNIIVEMANTAYIAMMDSDDVSEDDRLATQLTQLRNNEDVDIVTSSMSVLGSTDAPELWLRPSRKHDELATALLADSDIAFGTAFGRASAFKSFPFDPHLRFAEDYDFWTRTILGGTRVQSIEDPLYRYRRHASNSHSRVRDTATSVRDVKRRYHQATLRGPGAANFSAWMMWASELTYEHLDNPDIVDAALEMAVGTGLDNVWSPHLPKPLIADLARDIMSKLYVRQPALSSFRQIPLVARAYGLRATAVGIKRTASTWPPPVGRGGRPSYNWQSLL